MKIVVSEEEAETRYSDKWCAWRDDWEEANPDHRKRVKSAKTKSASRKVAMEFWAISDEWDEQYWRDNPGDAEITGNTESAAKNRVKNKAKAKSRMTADEIHAAAIFRAHGVTGRQYVALLEAQGSACAVCRKPSSESKNRLAVDHCHETGRIRGLLCMKCNMALGVHGDSLELVRKFVEYLENPPTLEQEDEETA